MPAPTVMVHVWHDEVISEADARRFVEADIFVVPTLSVMASAADSAVAELVRETDETMLSSDAAPDARRWLPGRTSGRARRWRWRTSGGCARPECGW